MRVLLAEDDPMIGASIRQGLSQDGFTVDWAEDGRAAELALAERVHDALVLDLGLPRRTGIEVLAAMRKRGDARPVLILTARDAIADRIAGLDAGADDYMVKPFDLDELSARLRALLRRSSGRSAPLMVHGDIELDPATREVRLRGEPVALSPREFEILKYLIKRRGQIVTREELLDNVWGVSRHLFTRTVDNHIAKLRQKIEPRPADPKYLVTLHRIGYKFLG